MSIQSYPNSGAGATYGWTVRAGTTTGEVPLTLFGDSYQYFTVTRAIPQGVYTVWFNNVTGSSIYFPNATTFVDGVAANSNTNIPLETVVGLSTSYSQFQFPVASRWDTQGNLSLGATGTTAWLAYGNNTAVLGVQVSTTAGSTLIFTSTNLTTWTGQTVPAVSGLWHNGYNNAAVWTGTTFLVAGDTATSLLISTNGTTWTTRATPGGGAIRSFNIANGIIFANPNVGTGGIFHTSTDGVNWTTRVGLGTQIMYGTAYHTTTGQYVRVGAGGTIYSSTNLTNWVTRNITGLINNFSNVIYGNGFMSAGLSNSSALALSTDGITWTTSPQGGLGNVWSGFFANGYHTYGAASAQNACFGVLSTFANAITTGTRYGFDQFSQSTAGFVIWTGSKYVSADYSGNYNGNAKIRTSSTLTGPTYVSAAGFLENKSGSTNTLI